LHKIMKKAKAKTIIITDSGFGGLSVLAGAYEALKEERFSFPLNLFFAEALPKNCPGYPWKGYSLMPDTETRIKVFNNVLKGMMHHFQPEMIAIVCNTLSAIVRETEFYQNHGDKILNIIDTGLAECGRMEREKDACIIILATQPTISSDMHRKGLADKGIFPNERIIPLAFPPDANYPLLIETEPESAKTQAVTAETLSKAFDLIPSKDTMIYVYLGCTHFGFVQNQYFEVLHKAGFRNVRIINPNTDMTRQVVQHIRDMNIVGEDKVYPLKTEVYSQFVLTREQVNSGSALISGISPAIAEALRQYTLKNDITEAWKE